VQVLVAWYVVIMFEFVRLIVNIHSDVITG
jgi:hypothetical protein